ncbi:MAG: hypothetical protein U0905_03580 [Pirellulales bacterium]
MAPFTRDPNSHDTSPKSDRSTPTVTAHSSARSHLRAWNPPSTSGRYHWNRLLLGCLCIGLLAGFAKLLQSPYERDAIHLMVLAPRYRVQSISIKHLRWIKLISGPVAMASTFEAVPRMLAFSWKIKLEWINKRSI